MDFIRSNYSIEKACEIIKAKYSLGDIIKAKRLGGIANDNYYIELADSAVVLKVYSHGQADRDKIIKEIEAVNIFKAAGISIPDFIAGSNGEILQEYEGFNVVLASFIDGPVLDELEFTPELMCQVGRVVASIEQVASGIDVSKFECMNFRQEFDYVYDGIDVVLEKRGINYDLTEYRANLARIYTIIDNLDAASAKQFLHKDIWPWNLIKKQDELYLIDFNDWAIGAPIIELAVALLEFSMFKSSQFNLEVARAIIEGYKQVKPLSYSQDELINAMLFICYLYFPYNVIQADDLAESAIYLERIHTLLGGEINLGDML